jgi:hypothetical protein
MRGLGLIATILFLLAACAPAKSSYQPSKTATFADSSQRLKMTVEVPKVVTNVEATHLEVVCGEAKCPPQVGLLAFYGEPDQKGLREIEVCTSFLVSADSIMSNGHCDQFGKMPGFFIGQTVNGQKNVRAIAGVLYKRYTPTNKGKQTRKPDVAIYKLESPITSMQPLRLATGAQIDFKTLTAYSIFVGDQPNQFKILSRTCTLHRHEAYFPFALSEAPNIIQSFGCQMIQGNSGSPMFAPGSDEVQAVHIGSNPIDDNAKEVKKKENRELLPFEKHLDSVAVNVRCLDYPGAKPITCTPADFASTGQRWIATKNFEMDKLLQREFPGADNYPVQFKVFRQQFNPTSPIPEFELIYLPKCRVKDVAVKTIPVVFERLRLMPDEWAVMKVDAQPVQTVDTPVSLLSGTVYRLHANWPVAPENLFDPEHDLRKQVAGAFNIDLPVCPR